MKTYPCKKCGKKIDRMLCPKCKTLNPEEYMKAREEFKKEDKIRENKLSKNKKANKLT